MNEWNKAKCMTDFADRKITCEDLLMQLVEWLCEGPSCEHCGWKKTY